MTERLSRYYAYVFVLFSLFIFFACSPTEPDEPQAQSATLASQSLQDGVQVKASSLTTVSFTFYRVATIVTPSAFTLNDTIVSAAVDPNDGKTIIVALPTLRESSAYTLRIAKGAISVDYTTDKRLNEAIEVHFTTKDAIKRHIAPLTNPNASTEALALYDQLMEYYGAYTLSGSMGGSDWTTKYADFLLKDVGHYPKVVGFDYLQIHWEPCNWVNYGDMTPIHDVWDKGGIVQIGWHWNVPETLYDPEPTHYHFYNDDFTTIFSAKQAVTPGTWQNKQIDTLICLVAKRLKLIEAEHIPVLFRPLHEAAGDYKWGSWFWWGHDGAEACVALWRYLHDKLQNEYQINNLIWVWTVQTSKAGNLADVSDLNAWYPGDDYVDIVGADLYIDNAGTSQIDRFNLINESVGGKKMIALSECGNLLSPDLCFENGDTWLYFMQWGQNEYDTWNSHDIWSQVMNNAHIINRE